MGDPITNYPDAVVWELQFRAGGEWFVGKKQSAQPSENEMREWMARLQADQLKVRYSFDRKEPVDAVRIVRKEIYIGDTIT